MTFFNRHFAALVLLTAMLTQAALAQPREQQGANGEERPATEATAKEGAARAERDPVFDMIARLPVAITDLRLVGEWSEGEEVGIYRTIITQDMVLGGASRLFVQWLVATDKGPRIKHQIEIGELAKERVNIVDFTLEKDEEGLALYLETVAADGGFSTGYEVFIRSPDDYLFQPIGN